MNQDISQNQNSDASLDSSNLIVFLYKWKWKIIIICFLAAVLSALASYLIEEKYKSTAIMFATQQHSFGEQLLEELKTEDILEYGEKEDAERLIQIINSDKIRNNIIEHFNLWEVYDIDTLEVLGGKTLMAKEYRSNVNAKMTRFGSIAVEVLDPDPKRAMEMVNRIVEYTDTVSNQLKNERAALAFNLAKNAYDQLQNDIGVLEDSLLSLRNKGVFDFFRQIETFNEQYATAIIEGNQARADKIREEMDKIGQYGSYYEKLKTTIYLSYDRETILKKRYDLMKIDMEENLPTKFVVDYASESDKKAYPIRWLIVAVSVMAAFIVSVLFLLVWDTIKKLQLQGKI